jgi:hypothetical protein
MGFTKSWIIVHCYNLNTATVTHASAIAFNECNTPIHASQHPSSGTLLLSATDTNARNIKTYIQYHINALPRIPKILFYIHFQPTENCTGCTIGTCTYFIAKKTDLLLAQQLSPYGPHLATYWIISLDNTEFCPYHAIISYLIPKQQPKNTTILSCFLAK